MILNNTNYQENPFLRRQTGRDSPVVSWAEQEILSSDQTEQESPHQSTPNHRPPMLYLVQDALR